MKFKAIFKSPSALEEAVNQCIEENYNNLDEETKKEIAEETRLWAHRFIKYGESVIVEFDSGLHPLHFGGAYDWAQASSDLLSEVKRLQEREACGRNVLIESHKQLKSENKILRKALELACDCHDGCGAKCKYSNKQYWIDKAEREINE